ncbi:MAG TPA: hypothetical protein VKA53_07740, partial [Thermoanaerobaculia bacterium]|nr:hypothetical protein [Thermoanaerobaculia bacterium]
MSMVAQLEGYRGGVVYTIDEEETRRLWEQYSDSHESFFRPPTASNRIVHEVVERSLGRHELKALDAEAWLDGSLEIFAGFVDDPALLEQVKKGTLWFVCDSAPPDRDVWSGECRMDKARNRPPITFLYTRSIACRLPGDVFDLGWTGALDHFVGHLYPYFQGDRDPASYDERVACRNQHLAAQVRARRDWRFRIVALLLPFIYRLHKRIALSAYRWTRGPGGP